MLNPFKKYKQEREQRPQQSARKYCMEIHNGRHCKTTHFQGVCPGCGVKATDSA